jgi:hypothetical protein
MVARASRSFGSIPVSGLDVMLGSITVLRASLARVYPQPALTKTNKRTNRLALQRKGNQTGIQ